LAIINEVLLRIGTPFRKDSLRVQTVTLVFKQFGQRIVNSQNIGPSKKWTQLIHLLLREIYQPFASIHQQNNFRKYKLDIGFK
jgi:hypothetical protein